MILIEKHWFYSNFPPGCCAHNGLVAGSSRAGPTSLRSRSDDGCRAEGAHVAHEISRNGGRQF
jgi:hypothetical protein